MRALSKTTHIDFMGPRRLAGAVSILLVLASIFLLATRGLNFGIDFTGGVLVEVGYPEAVELAHVREKLADSEYADAVVQHFGSSQDVMIRLAPSDAAKGAELSDAVYQVLRSRGDDVTLRRVEFVGPQVGEELTINGGLAAIWALACIFIYVLFRFHWKFSAGAVACLIHDVILVFGMFSLLRLEFDLAVLAAVLAVIGYSLNDTIVVFDRCRENFQRKTGEDEPGVINRSLNEMLSRTLMTSGTTLLVLLSLYYLGGEALSGFSLALIAGIVIGTYSSIYVASNFSLAIGLKRDDLVPPPPPDNVDPSGAQV